MAYNTLPSASVEQTAPEQVAERLRQKVDPLVHDAALLVAQADLPDGKLHSEPYVPPTTPVSKRERIARMFKGKKPASQPNLRVVRDVRDGKASDMELEVRREVVYEPAAGSNTEPRLVACWQTIHCTNAAAMEFSGDANDQDIQLALWFNRGGQASSIRMTWRDSYPQAAEQQAYRGHGEPGLYRVAQMLRKGAYELAPEHASGLLAGKGFDAFQTVRSNSFVGVRLGGTPVLTAGKQSYGIGGRFDTAGHVPLYSGLDTYSLETVATYAYDGQQYQLAEQNREPFLSLVEAGVMDVAMPASMVQNIVSDMATIGTA